MALKEKILEVAGGPHVAAVATVNMGMPAVRFMVLNGFEDMTFVGATMKNTRKVAQLRKEPCGGHLHLVGEGVLRPLRRDHRRGGRSTRMSRPRRGYLEPDVRAVLQIGG